MRITRLRLTGFKSFVDPADLVIAPGLTGVVGPNGCGKSNLLEALRWAMGENSARSLRGAGMEDVIFAGTASRPPRDFAEVMIHTEDADGAHEVVRRIERGAGSAYRIDGRDVRAKDVALLFADAATGAHSPALVSQNRIGAVIAAKPAERRQMLEEAAGIAGLHVRRRDAEAKLRATEMNLEKLDALIAETATRVAQLRRQARQAERYRAIANEVRVAEARLVFARWREAARAADAATAEATTAGAAVQSAAAAQAEVTEKAARATALLGAARGAALAARDSVTAAAHRLATLRAEKTAAERRLADIAGAVAQIGQDRGHEDALASDAASALARLAEEGKAADRALTTAAAARPSLDATLAQAERASRDAEVALAQATARVAQQTAEARIAAAALAQATARRDRAAREAAASAAALASIPDPAPLRAEQATAARDAEAATAAGVAARTAAADGEEAERAAIVRRDAATAARATARADLSAIEAEAAALARTLRHGGARDRLIDHVRADTGFERALAAALGDDLEAGLEPGSDRHWAGAVTAPGDPALPDGGVPLARHVAAPTALARRLAQVLVVAEDAGQALAAGQRLVTQAGTLRRWDGLVVRHGGGAAAERLERRNRLTALEAATPAARADVEASDRDMAAADRAVGDAQARARDGRAAAERHERAARDAAARADRAAALLDRHAGQRSDAGMRHARTAAEAEEALTDHARALATHDALPDLTRVEAGVAALRRDADMCRAAVAAARDAVAGADRATATARERLATIQAEARSWRARAGDAARRIADMDKRAGDLAAEGAALSDRPAALDAAIADESAAHDVERHHAEQLAAAEGAAEAALRQAERLAHEAGETLAAAREARAGAVARAESHQARRMEMGRVSGERFQCPAPVLPERIGFDGAAVRAPAEESAIHDRWLRERERIGPVNLVAERELAELEAGGAGNAVERDELGQAVHRLRGSIGALNREGRQRLLAAFEAVDAHFRRLFTTLFDGGHAHLTLIDSDDPLEAGLEIMAQPPGKRLQSLTLLSGGEQALTAVALIFGLFLTNPAPICVLDEVDAPLDDANIERFCGLLDRMAAETDTRYLIVTHNAVTMSRMHRLFGVTMIERGVSRLVSVDLQAAAGMLAAG